MGKSSISRVYEDWIHLDHQPFRVLVYLALRSLDAETPPVYYAGWEEIARAANLPWDPDEPYVDHLEESERKAVLERRRRARKKYKNRVGELLRTLEDAGAVLRSGDAKQGTAQVVALTLEPTVSYAATRWTTRPRYKTNSDGEKELLYEVRVPDWQPIPRQDPRPLAPSQGGPGDPTQRGPGVPTQRGPGVPPERGKRTPGRGDPRNTHDPSQDPGEETGERTTAITSQRNPSTRGREEAAVPVSAPAAADEPLSQQERVNAADAALRAQFPEYYDDDLAPTA
ncbi:hypothetical protein M3C33_009720 [Micrococcus luteus]|nr:hypothetical protein [Micrococcus luteus]TFI08101.1 hypothetical protein E4P35_13730 [Thiopseudomonas sp. 4R-3cl]MCV7459236.1 hypothetical protein [Micrococcus luteus]MCV7643202.1 hypothetical protein [Micrococcus luteus]MCV7676836.1 hypothetical protein [Micrococcus luteus]